MPTNYRLHLKKYKRLYTRNVKPTRNKYNISHQLTKQINYDNNKHTPVSRIWLHKRVHQRNDLSKILRRHRKKFHKCNNKGARHKKETRTELPKNRNNLLPYYNDGNRITIKKTIL